jgi:hypothetical protein
MPEPKFEDRPVEERVIGILSAIVSDASGPHYSLGSVILTIP